LRRGDEMNMRTTVLATCAMAMLWAGCDGSSDGMATTASVAGTLTLPGTATSPYFVRLLTTAGAGATTAAETTGTTNGTTALAYSIPDVPAGTYFMLAGVDVDSSGGDSSTTGDYRGWYGHAGDGNPPAAPNVVVPASGTVTIDYSLVVAP
jgi:hypothetical protein